MRGRKIKGMQTSIFAHLFEKQTKKEKKRVNHIAPRSKINSMNYFAGNQNQGRRKSV
jgi:hypothetical protein